MRNLLLPDDYVEFYLKHVDGIGSACASWNFTKNHNSEEITKEIYIEMFSNFLKSFSWCCLNFIETNSKENFKSEDDFYVTLNDFKNEQLFYQGFPYYSFCLGLKFSSSINKEIQTLYSTDNYFVIQTNQKLVQINLELRPEMFFNTMRNVEQKEFSNEYVKHNKNMLTNSFTMMETFGYTISYLPIGYTKAYARGARWDETGFLEYGKYSKYSDIHLIALHKEMKSKREDISEIELELQFRKLSHK